MATISQPHEPKDYHHRHYRLTLFQAVAAVCGSVAALIAAAVTIIELFL